MIKERGRNNLKIILLRRKDMDEKNIQELMLIYGMKSTEELVAISGNAESPIERGIAVKK